MVLGQDGLQGFFNGFLGFRAPICEVACQHHNHVLGYHQQELLKAAGDFDKLKPFLFLQCRAFTTVYEFHEL